MVSSAANGPNLSLAQTNERCTGSPLACHLLQVQKSRPGRIQASRAKATLTVLSLLVTFNWRQRCETLRREAAIFCGCREDISFS